MSEHDQPEAAELERAAEWRERQADAHPDDAAHLRAAALLRNLAAEVRAGEGSALLHEFRCICNWLGESDGIEDLVQLMRDFHTRIGISEFPADGQDYLRNLIALSHKTFGAP